VKKNRWRIGEGTLLEPPRQDTVLRVSPTPQRKSVRSVPRPNGQAGQGQHIPLSPASDREPRGKLGSLPGRSWQLAQLQATQLAKLGQAFEPRRFF
jgi:hypothetical protein